MWEENCIVQPVTFRKTFASFNERYIGFRQHDSVEALSALMVQSKELSWIQRLGFLLEALHKGELAKVVYGFLEKKQNF